MPDSAPRISFAWHLCRWRHSAPGTRGLVILSVLGLVLVLPTHRIGIGDTWAAAHRTFLMLGTLVAAFLIARDTAVSDESEFWLQQKGISPADWAFSKWRANLLPLFCFAALFTVLLFGAAPLYGLTPSLTLSLTLIATLSCTLVVMSVLLFGLGSTGSPNAPELGMLIVLLTFVAPVFASALPAALQAVLRFGLPPIFVVAQLRDAVEMRAWETAGRLALHIGGWCTLVMLGSVSLLERRTPRG